jgi:hypothetical protein
MNIPAKSPESVITGILQLKMKDIGKLVLVLILVTHIVMKNSNSGFSGDFIPEF